MNFKLIRLKFINKFVMINKPKGVVSSKKLLSQHNDS